MSDEPVLVGMIRDVRRDVGKVFDKVGEQGKQIARLEENVKNIDGKVNVLDSKVHDIKLKVCNSPVPINPDSSDDTMFTGTLKVRSWKDTISGSLLVALLGMFIADKVGWI